MPKHRLQVGAAATGSRTFPKSNDGALAAFRARGAVLIERDARPAIVGVAVVLLGISVLLALRGPRAGPATMGVRETCK